MPREGVERARLKRLKYAVVQKGNRREQWTRSSLFLRYGITLEEYEIVFRRQNGVCAFCGRRPSRNRLAVDHDHRTGRFRGLLCTPCNRALGNLEANMDRVVKYLRGEVSVPS